uniref:Uncharacterized protein n=1 Tax=Panagrolaimus sp. ES5 TaxID=591445 RepID=A0AC34F747_9BILA
MILSPESLPNDPMLHILNILQDIVENESNIILLYGQEERYCKKRLTQKGFTASGWFKIANNNFVYEPDSPDKVFDIYELYTKGVDDTNVIIGCRNGFFTNAPEKKFKQDTENAEIICSNDDELEELPFVYHARYCKTKHQEARWIDETDIRKNDKLQYQNMKINNGTKTCCERITKHDALEKWHKYGIPGFEQTKVQEIVYMDKNTEMYLSNGLMTMLTHKKEEPDFFKIWHGSKRLIFRCSTHDRRAINAVGLREFLEFVEHIEFAGFWWTELFKYILPRFPESLKAWSMTRIALERQSLREIMNNLPSDLFDNIEKFHYDGRDTRGDRNIASIFNALHKENIGFKNLKDLIIIANTFSCSQFNSNLDKVLDVCFNIII